MLPLRSAQIDLLGRRGRAADGTSNRANRSANRHTGRTRDYANQRATPSAHAGTAGTAAPRRIAASCEKDGGAQRNGHTQRSRDLFHAAHPPVCGRVYLHRAIRRKVCALSLVELSFVGSRP